MVLQTIHHPFIELYPNSSMGVQQDLVAWTQVLLARNQFQLKPSNHVRENDLHLQNGELLSDAISAP